MARKDLLSSGENDESTKEPLLASGDETNVSELTDSELKRLRSECLRDFADNDGVIFEITEYPIKDGESLSRGAFKGYKIRTIAVDGLLFKKRGFVTINNDVDLPLYKNRILNSGPWYFMNKQETMDKYEQLLNLELSRIKKEEARQEEILTDIRAARKFAEDLLQNGRF